MIPTIPHQKARRLRITLMSCFSLLKNTVYASNQIPQTRSDLIELSQILSTEMISNSPDPLFENSLVLQIMNPILLPVLLKWVAISHVRYADESVV